MVAPDANLPQVKRPKRGRSLGEIVGILVFIIFIASVFSWISPTKETADARKVSNERSRQLCAVSSFCERYTGMRQACAPAGNFDKCMNVKIGDKDMWRVHYCTAEGGLTNLPAEAIMPNFVACLYYNMGG